MLYNKHRPKYFKELIGQELTKELLVNFLTSKDSIHSFVFYGPNGTGKTTAARLFSQAVNCSKFSKNKELCRSCDSCKSIENGECTDLIEIDGATHNGVEYIREIIKNSVYPPLLLSKKVYIIDEAHCLSYQAWNALLKLIEEPPQHLILIFLTTAIQKIIPTILSRCQKLFFAPIKTEDLNQLLLHISQIEKKKVDSEIISKLSEASKGSAREAIVSLEKLLTDTKSIDSLTNLERESLELLNLMLNSNYLEAIKRVKKNLVNSNKLFELVLERLLELSFYQLTSSKEVLSSLSEEQAKSVLSSGLNLNSMINFLAPALSTGPNQFSLSYSKYLLVNLFENCGKVVVKEVKKEVIEEKKVSIEEKRSEKGSLSESVTETVKTITLPEAKKLFKHHMLGIDNIDLPQFNSIQLLPEEKEMILLLRRADRETSQEHYFLLKDYLEAKDNEEKELVISQLFEDMIPKYELICSSDSKCVVVFPDENKANYFNLKVKNLEIIKTLYKIFGFTIAWKGITLSELQNAIKKNKGFKEGPVTPKAINQEEIGRIERIREVFLSEPRSKFLA
ncbi:DNA polymerase III subunits gamma and tau [Mycoplasma wenyonii str. Massachusetts]|uniref:DNA polymerase III subunit gamma/tau n=1 Tax=Mycoplasma wenyonii (strain Massachusetts) TaxID=1197325 RepID=I6YMB0_MYCWM|nr:DNA polymerase III subunit gamma/tau [Mycoplasma wenyonii]AFN65449.1 DNA polymerase III subunits gamma and tau [Mycoplasma wenyonii str. Massachusetts]